MAGRQQGYVLISVILMLFVIAVTAYLVSYDTSLQATQPENRLEAVRADYVAQAALQHAYWRNGQSACVANFTIPSAPLGDDTYTVSASGGGSTSKVVLFADQDTMIRSDDIGRNQGSDTELHTRYEASTGKTEYALYRFDVSSLAPGTTIASAVAWFHVKDGKAHPEGPITVHSVTTAWNELDINWKNFGSAFEPAEIATIPTQPVGGIWVPVNLSGQVQAWVNSGENNGILLASEADEIHAHYFSKEDATRAPRLEVTIATSAVSPVQLHATATLASGISRTALRSNVNVYQPSSSVVSGVGDAIRDTYVSSANAATNYGSDLAIEVGDAGGSRYGLLDFNLGGVPRGARIIEAKLTLNLESVGAAPGGALLSVHRMLEPWTEADATYKKADGSQNWGWPDNHDSTSVVLSIPFESPANGPVSLDVTGIFEQWAAGKAPDYGLALASAHGVDAARFTSSDAADTTRHPRLEVSYACPCGTVCLPTAGSGRVVLVVVNDDNLSDYEFSLYRMLASWGYDVTLFKSNSNQAEVSALADNHDVIFVPDTGAAQIKDKLENLTIGVVMMHGDAAKESGLVDGWNGSVGDEIGILDASHYITSAFTSTSVPIYDGNMDGVSGSGAMAPDLEVLATWNGAPGVAVLERGKATTGGVSPGRRVVLPFGRNKGEGFDWRFVSQEGRLLAHRSIEWALGPRLPEATVLVLFVVGDAGLLTAEEIAKTILFEGMGFAVEFITDDAPQLEYDQALLTADVAFISREAAHGAIGNRLAATDFGIVSEHKDLADDFGFSERTRDERNETHVDIDNSFFISLELPAGSLQILTDDRDLFYLDRDVAPGAEIVATVKGEPALATLDEGAEMTDGNPAPGRRVFLPWGDNNMDISLLTADGLSLLQRSLDWAAGNAGLAKRTYLLTTEKDAVLGGLSFSEFDIVEYDTWTDTATLYFDGDPIDLNKAIDGFHLLEDGKMLISLNGDGRLAGVDLKDGDIALYDPVADSAAVVFVGADHFDDNREKLKSLHLLGNGHFVFNSGDDARIGGLDIKEEDLVEYDPVSGTASLLFDSGPTTIDRELSSVYVADDGTLILSARDDTTLGGEVIDRADMVEYDSVDDEATVVFYGADVFEDNKTKISSVHFGAGSGSYGCDGTFRDEFNTASFAGSDGTLDWAGGWLEIGESDGAVSGDVLVTDDFSNFQLRTQDNDNGGEGVEREVRLAGAVTATLRYDYRRDSLGGSEDYTSVEISANGAAGPWTELARYEGPADDGAYQNAEHDIADYASNQTRIRFRTGPDMDKNDAVWFDNIEISCSM